MRAAVFFFLLAVSAAARAEWQEIGAVRAAAERFVREQTRSLPGEVVIEVGALDPRLRLARCDELRAFVPPGARLWGSSTVGVRCAQPSSWTVYVPLVVRVMTEVAVAANTLPRGHALTRQDIALLRTDVAHEPPGMLTDPGQALGKILAVSVAARAPLRPDMLRDAYAVVQGQAVKLVYQGEGFQVGAEGKSLGNAAVGQAVQVRTPSGRIVKGVAKASGVVEVR